MKRICFIVIFSIFMAGASLAAQTINTVAGGGPVYPLPALSAPIGNPQAVAFDANGNTYFASGRQVFKVDNTGELSVFAGNGSPCPPLNPSPACGDGGPATSANLNGPTGLAVDAAGNVYIADRAAARIRKVDTTGVITTFAGNGTRGFSGDGGPATSASFYLPNSVAVDPVTGNVYIADTYNNRIRVVDPSGTINTFAGNGTSCGINYNPGSCGDGQPAPQASLTLPWSVAVGPPGIVYIADRGDNRVRAVWPGGGPISTVLGPGSLYCQAGQPCTFPGGGSADLSSPQAVVAVPAVFGVGVIDSADSRIEVEALNPASLAPAVMVRVTGNCFNDAGAPCFPAPLAGASGLAVAPGGNLYVAASGDIDDTGSPVGGGLTPVAGNGTVAYYGDGGPATRSSFDSPPGSVRDAAGNIYIPDPGDDVVREVSASTGDISTIAGIPGQPGFSGDSGPATSANLNVPTGVALDGAGNLYIADSRNGSVRKMNLSSGTISTVAGNGVSCRAAQPPPATGLGQWIGYCYTGDGGPATSASLGIPQGVALDSAGDLFIADSGNNLVLEVNASTGYISTVAGDGTECQSPQYGGPCYGGDNGPATSASLFNPTSVAVDSSGDVYIADSLNDRVRMVDTAGAITTFAGNGTAGFSGDGGLAVDATLNNPQGVALDSAGNLYIADTVNQRIRMVTASTGAINTVAGNGTLGFSGDGGSPLMASLFGPSGVFVDNAGGLWIADGGNRRIRSVGNTSAGNNVAAAPLDSATGTSPVTLTFSTVTQAGNVALTTSTTGPSTPSGFQLGSPATYYMLTTSAVYSGSIQICINYSGVSYTDPSQLSIWHYDTASSSWTQLSTTLDTATTTACATAPSLSPFAIFEPAYAAQVQQPIDAGGSSVFKAGSAVPVKFTLTLSGAQTCQLPPATISLNLVSSTAPGPINTSVYSMPSDAGSSFRIDTTACQYVYNLGTKSLGTGAYRVNIVIGGAIVGSGVFGLD